MHKWVASHNFFLFLPNKGVTPSLEGFSNGGKEKETPKAFPKKKKKTIVAVKSMSCHTAKECGHLIPSRYEKRNIY